MPCKAGDYFIKWGPFWLLKSLFIKYLSKLKGTFWIIQNLDQLYWSLDINPTKVDMQALEDESLNLKNPLDHPPKYCYQRTFPAIKRFHADKENKI